MMFAWCILPVDSWQTAADFTIMFCGGFLWGYTCPMKRLCVPDFSSLSHSYLPCDSLPLIHVCFFFFTTKNCIFCFSSTNTLFYLFESLYFYSICFAKAKMHLLFWQNTHPLKIKVNQSSIKVNQNLKCSTMFTIYQVQPLYKDTLSISEASDPWLHKNIL